VIDGSDHSHRAIAAPYRLTVAPPHRRTAAPPHRRGCVVPRRYRAAIMQLFVTVAAVVVDAAAVAFSR